jgi:hypothetical protein
MDAPGLVRHRVAIQQIAQRADEEREGSPFSGRERTLLSITHFLDQPPVLL